VDRSNVRSQTARGPFNRGKGGVWPVAASTQAQVLVDGGQLERGLGLRFGTGAALRKDGKMQPFWFQSGEFAMPTTLTLKNIPDAVYERLKASAQSHRRSLNSEAIVCLEAVLLPTRMTPVERLARARELRAALPKGKFSAPDIDAFKRADRP
jgi:plasmid stability protein